MHQKNPSLLLFPAPICRPYCSSLNDVTKGISKGSLLRTTSFPDTCYVHWVTARVTAHLVSLVAPPLVHPVGALRRERGHVVAVGLGHKAVVQRVESQAGAGVALLVAGERAGRMKKNNDD